MSRCRLSQRWPGDILRSRLILQRVGITGYKRCLQVSAVLLVPLAIAAGAFRAEAAIGASSDLVTSSGATGIRLCFFGGSGHGGTTAPRSCRDEHGQSDLAAVIKEVNAQRAVAAGAHSCPSDSGSEVRFVVTYRDGHRERVDAHLSGCSFATHPPRTAKQTSTSERRDLARRAGFNGAIS